MLQFKKGNQALNPEWGITHVSAVRGVLLNVVCKLARSRCHLHARLRTWTD